MRQIPIEKIKEIFNLECYVVSCCSRHSFVKFSKHSLVIFRVAQARVTVRNRSWHTSNSSSLPVRSHNSMSPFYTRSNRRGYLSQYFFTSPLKFRRTTTHRGGVTPRGWALEIFSTRQEGWCSAKFSYTPPRGVKSTRCTTKPKKSVGIFPTENHHHPPRQLDTPRWGAEKFSTGREGWCSANFFLGPTAAPTCRGWSGGVKI